MSILVSVSPSLPPLSISLKEGTGGNLLPSNCIFSNDFSKVPTVLFINDPVFSLPKIRHKKQSRIPQNPVNLGKREVAPHLPCEDVGETARLPFASVFTDTAEARLQESSMRDAAAEPGTPEEPHRPSKPAISPILLAWLETRLRHPPLFAFHTSRDLLPPRCSLEEVGSLPVKISQQIVTVLRIQNPYYKLQGSVLALPHPMNSFHTLSSTFFHCPSVQDALLPWLHPTRYRSPIHLILTG